MSEKCEFHELISDKVKQHDHEIRDIKSDINDLKVSQTEVNTTFVSFMKSMDKQMEKQTEILETMNLAQIETAYEIKDMKNDIKGIKQCQKDQKDEVDVINEESKVNTRKWIRDNYWKLVLIIAVLGIGATFIIQKILESTVK